MNIVSDDGFRFMTVAQTCRIARRMQRLRLTGDDLSGFDTFENLHLRLHIPTEPNMVLSESALGSHQSPRSYDGAQSWITRYYTIRHIDADAGWLDIDFVLHDDAGPACDFARRANIGDVCGISGPCGLSVKPASIYLLAGDETAFPAIARILENLPKDAQGLALIKTHDMDAAVELTVPEGMYLRWFCRRHGGADNFLQNAAQAISTLAAGSDDYFIWIAGEYSDWKAIRPHLRGIPKKHYINVVYWDALKREMVSG
ncbi:siderophore-interacting protein [Rhizobium sp. LEGMi135b]